MFWILQVSGWSLLTLFQFLVFYYPKHPDMSTVAGLLVTYLTGFLLSIVLRYYYRRSGYQSRSISSLFIHVLIYSMIGAIIWYWLDGILSIPIWGLKWGVEFFQRYKNIQKLIGTVFSHFLILFSWSGLYFVIKLWQEWSIQKERTEKANALAQAAQLQMLRYQLNPHFLFNSLNSIRALVDEDKKNAKEMITELSEFLRYSLISKTYSDVPLNNEIEAIRHYFAIEKKRYEEKLDVEIDIDPLAQDYPVLSFLIHPLVENAVKYGMQTSPMPLKIRIKAEVIKERLQIRVSNTGNWVEPSKEREMDEVGTGTGLKNVRQRLDNSFPGRYRLDVEEKEGWVVITLQIGKDVD